MAIVIDFCILLFILSTGSVFAESGFDPRVISTHAAEDLNAFNVQSTVDDMETAISSSPGDIGKYVPLINFYYSNQIWDKAEDVLKDAIDRFPGEHTIDLNGWLADDLLDQKKWDEAKGYLDIALKGFPDEAMLYYDLGIYYFYKGDYVSAGRLMKTIALKDKDTQDTYYAFYDQLLDKDKPQPGLVVMVKAALDAEPDNFKTQRLYAAALRNVHFRDFSQQLPEILEHLNTALKLNPKFTLTYISIFDTYLLLGNNQNDPKYYKTALEWLDKAKALHDPACKDLDFDYANIYFQMSDYEKAIRYAEKYHKADPDDQGGTDILGEAYNNLAYDDYEKGTRLRQGIDIIDKAITLAPANGMYLSTKAELLYKLKDYEQAYTLITKAHILLPKEEEINKDIVMIENALKSDKK